MASLESEDATVNPLEESSVRGSSHPEVLLFSPNSSQQSILKSFDNIPKYLFRLSAPSTVGKTTTVEVTSPAWRRGKNKEDLFSLPPEESATRLNAHLRWDSHHERQCNLMSWSSSLLFLLQYGLYRHKNDFDNPSYSDIHLLVIDTRQFPKGTFIRDLEVIEEFHKFHTPQMSSESLAIVHGWRASKLYFGEYLTQGRLHIDGKCSQTSMQRLIDLGLFTLCPPLEDDEPSKKWAKAVLEIRNGFEVAVKDTDKKSVRIAITMAQACFGTRWSLPLAVMLLSLQRRQYDDRTIIDGFHSMFTGKFQDP